MLKKSVSQKISNALFNYCNVSAVWFLWSRILKIKKTKKSGKMMCRTILDKVLIVNVDDYIGKSICTFGIYEPETIWFLRKFLKKNDVFFDVGANIGDTCCLAASFVGEQGLVYAFEPSGLNYDLLKANIEINKIENIIPFKTAVGDLNTIGYINIRDQRNRGKDSIVLSKTSSNDEITQILSLDYLVKKNSIRKPRLIKIDVEGFEFQVLKGAEGLINCEEAPILILEYKKTIKQGYELEDVFRHLEQTNRYDIFTFKTGFRLQYFKLVKVNDPSRIPECQIYCLPKKIKFIKN